MTPPASGWNEAGQSENPVVELLEKLGYTYVQPETLEAERESLRATSLTARLGRALKSLNPWLSDDNVHKVIRAVTSPEAASLIEANEKVYTALTYGISVSQDLGDGRTSPQVHFFDFDDPRKNEWLVTRQYKVRGTKKHVVPDVVCFVNGIPLAVIECKSPTLGDAWKHDALDQLDRYQELSDKYRELGAPRLFDTVQLTVATCGQDACYGTVTTPGRFYLRWNDPYPMSRASRGGWAGESPRQPGVLGWGVAAGEADV